MAESKDTPGKLHKVPIIENRNFGDTSAYAPGDKIYHVQNSHMNLIGGLKVSRDVWVKEFKMVVESKDSRIDGDGWTGR